MAIDNLSDRKQRAADEIQSASAAFREISLSIHANPELNYAEHHAHATLTDFLESRGFTVERSAYGLQTAFRAVAGSGTPTLAIFAEYDALPGLGHACGHNLIAISALATALALKATLNPGEGTIVVLGSPAEEGGGAKIVMAERGALANVDAAMMLHPSTGDTAWPSMSAAETFQIEYRGRNAHAAAAPWQGVNALDAMVLAYSAVSAMRQQLRPTDRVHGVITSGGEKANIIPDFTSAEFMIRARTIAELDEVRKKIHGCLQGAATATGCTLSIEAFPPYADVHTNDVLAGLYTSNMAVIGRTLPTGPSSSALGGASTDMGNISYLLPSIHPVYAIPTEDGAGNHTPGFTAAAATIPAHEATLRAATALAMTALDLYAHPELLAEAQDEFRNG